MERMGPPNAKKIKLDTKAGKEPNQPKCNDKDTGEYERDYVVFNSDDEGYNADSRPVVTIGTINHGYPILPDGSNDYSSLVLKEKDDDFPIYVAPSGLIYLFTLHPMSQFAKEFLIAIAEPVSRPNFVHTYKLTSNSLYAAVSSGISAKVIKEHLELMCKTDLPHAIAKFIQVSTKYFGKAKEVLKDGQFLIESKDLNHLEWLSSDSEIKSYLLKDENGEIVFTENCLSKSEHKAEEGDKKIVGTHTDEYEYDIEEIAECDMTDIALSSNNIKDYACAANDGKLKSKTVQYFVQIIKGCQQNVHKRCQTLNACLLSEYDFMIDNEARSINMKLNKFTKLRPYQEKSLSKMISHGRARSGIIVLPCGAGKTLVGVSAACLLQKACIVFCSSAVAVEQWKEHFVKHTTLSSKRVTVFTGNKKEDFKNCDVFITTYSMMANIEKKNYDSMKTLRWVLKESWGLILLDEVHTIPADTFRKVLDEVKGHCKLGLTATLVREDNKIDDLNFIVGPKLYEADWMELQDKGYIARIQCMEVRCPMTPDFFLEYIKAPKLLLSVMNPEKLRRCQFLVNYHEKRGDKILVFSDNLFALHTYAKLMGKPYLEGKTHHTERMNVMENFKKNDKINTLFVSKLADIALDLPEANVLIQISSQGGSRRQEAQRLGRITRKKKNMQANQISGFFYSLISSDTDEVKFCVKRQRYLQDQGYTYKVIDKLDGMEKEKLLMETKAQYMELLKEVLNSKESDNIVENVTSKRQKKNMNKNDLLAKINRKKKMQ